MERLHERLVDEVRKIRTGGDWRAWLDTAARFHDYSFGNVLLIVMQRPDATRVAGYETWKQLGRQVTKGEKGIKILAPMIRRRPGARNASNPVTSLTSPEPSSPGRPSDDAPLPSDGGQRESTASDRKPQRDGGEIFGFRVVHVWDVSQTTGAELPTPPRPERIAQLAPEGLWDALASQVTATGYTLRRDVVADADCQGYTDYRGRLVVVADRLEPGDAVATLAHEVAHMLMHNPADFADGTSRGCRGQREVEAESVAYLIAAHHGLPTDAATFPYVATWAATVDPHEPERIVQAVGQRVTATTQQLLNNLTIAAEIDDDNTITTAAFSRGAAEARDDSQDVTNCTDHGQISTEPGVRQAPMQSTSLADHNPGRHARVAPHNQAGNEATIDIDHGPSL